MIAAIEKIRAGRVAEPIVQDRFFRKVRQDTETFQRETGKWDDASQTAIQ